MSWCRWSSPCWASMPSEPINEAACGEKCPGSSVYAYERQHPNGSEDFAITCCCGSGDDGADGADFIAYSVAGMVAHLRGHVWAGDHVRPGLWHDDSELVKTLVERGEWPLEGPG